MEYAKTIDGSSAKEAIGIMMTDEFAHAFAEAIPVELLEVDLAEESTGTWRRVMECHFNTSGLDMPSLARAFLPNEVSLTWDETWTVQSDDSASSELHVTIAGSPSAHTRGHVVLSSDSGRIGYRYKGQTTVDVPFVGGRLGGLVDDHLVGGILDDLLDVLATMTAST